MRREDGYSLIEVLMALALLGLVVAVAYTLFFSGLTTWRRGVSRMDCQQNARVAMDQMVKELRFAGWVEIPAGINGEIRYTFRDTLPDILYYRFRLDGEELVREGVKESGVFAHTKIALQVTGLDFTIDAKKNVHITLSTGAGTEQVTVKSSVRPKNVP